MPTEGQRIATYELVRKLGEGAFGEVWLGRHADLGAERALKIPTDPDYVKQLRQEGRIQFELKHPNIVQTLDLDTSHDPPYFVMEYVEGRDLRKHLEAAGRLAPPEALSILCQLLDALTAAHAQGIIHRDLKPENILVTERGQVKITDFGLGKVQAGVAQSLILSGSMVSSEGKSVSGTYAYMSPEQQLGQPSDPRDDVYAVGLIGCELLAGSRPSGVGVARLFQRAGLDAALCRIFERALEEAAHRYPTAGEMLADLQAYWAGAPAVGIPPVPPPAEVVPPLAAPPPLPPKRKRRKAAAVWGGIVGVGLIVLVVGIFMAAIESEEDDEPPDDSRRKNTPPQVSVTKRVVDPAGTFELTVPEDWRGPFGPRSLSVSHPVHGVGVSVQAAPRQAPDVDAFARAMAYQWQRQVPGWTIQSQGATRVSGYPAIHIRATGYPLGQLATADYYLAVTARSQFVLWFTYPPQAAAQWQGVFQRILATWRIR